MLRSTALRCPGKPIPIKPLVLLLLIWVLPLPTLSADSGKLERLRQRALEGEKRGAWLDAYRCYDDILRNDRNNTAAREGQRRCSVPALRLCHDVVCRKHRKFGRDGRLQRSAGDYVDILWRDQGENPLDSGAQHAFVPGDLEKLLWIVGSAQRPEPLPCSPCHNNCDPLHADLLEHNRTGSCG